MTVASPSALEIGAPPRPGRARSRFRSQYFPHIDGLRAVAILPVVLFHLFQRLCPGGFTGVDVFFVISGYLITGGIIADLGNDEFSISSFYVRRIKRILPAYFAIIAFVLLSFPFAIEFWNYGSICKTALYSAFYSTNIYFERVISYFDVEAKLNPLLHLWSLGVEEQFYFVIPVLLLALWRFKNKAVLPSLIFLFVLSFVSSVWLIHLGRLQFAFYMIFTRAWELLAGAIASQTRITTQEGSRRWSWVPWTGLILVLIPYAFYSERTPFPGGAAVPSVLGSSLLILYGTRGSVNRLLSSGPMVWIGKVSYSLYLWHWPVFVLFKLNDYASLKKIAAAVCATALGTFLSYRYIELPVRRRKSFGKVHAFSMVAVGMAVITAFCLFISAQKSRMGELAENWRGKPTWMAAELARDKSRSACRLEELNTPDSKYLIRIGKTNVPPSFALWGDSHALALLPGVDIVAEQYGKSGYFINLKHSLTSNQNIGAYPFNPKADREPVLRWLEAHGEISDVFLVNRWFAQLQSAADLEETAFLCVRLGKAGKRLFLFTNVPMANQKAFRHLSRVMGLSDATAVTSLRDYQAQAGLENQLIQMLEKRKLAAVLPIDKAFFDGGVYRTMTESNSYYTDSIHLNQAGSVRAMKFVSPLIWHGITAN